jgi:hypothetical protein
LECRTAAADILDETNAWCLQMFSDTYLSLSAMPQSISLPVEKYQM